MRVGILVAAVVLAVFGAGCGPEQGMGQGNGPGPQQPGPDAARVTQTDLDKVQKAGKQYRLALIVKTRNNPFFDPMIKAAEAEAKVIGAVLEVQSPAQETDKERQFALVQDVIARGVDAVLIAPADSKGIVPALKQAQERGILVINLDNRVDPATAAAKGLNLGGYVGADNEEGGRLAGEAMVEALTGSGKVAILEGIRGADNAEARKRGFTKAVQGKLEIAASESAEWDTQKAYAKFQAMMTAHPGLGGLFCANDKMALGALKAIREAGKKAQIVVIGYDNIPDVQPYLSSGEMLATIEQHPDLMGKYGVKVAVGVLDGAVPKGKEFLVPLEAVSKAP
jgi:ribose transport system substrate-binding protein